MLSLSQHISLSPFPPPAVPWYLKDGVVEDALQELVGGVDQKLLEAVQSLVLEAEDVQHPDHPPPLATPITPRLLLPQGPPRGQTTRKRGQTTRKRGFASSFLHSVASLKASVDLADDPLEEPRVEGPRQGVPKGHFRAHLKPRRHGLAAGQPPNLIGGMQHATTTTMEPKRKKKKEEKRRKKSSRKLVRTGA